MLAAGMVASGAGYDSRLIKVQHMVYYPEKLVDRPCALEVVREASVGQRSSIAELPNLLTAEAQIKF